MSFAPGRPGAKKGSQDKAKDKNFEEQKLRMLERAEKNLAKVKNLLICPHTSLDKLSQHTRDVRDVCTEKCKGAGA